MKTNNKIAVTGEVTTRNMKYVWRKLWLECVIKFEGFPQEEEIEKVQKEIVQLAEDVGFVGVDKDVQELIVGHSENLMMIIWCLWNRRDHWKRIEENLYLHLQKSYQ